jgi:hypothetical protein
MAITTGPVSHKQSEDLVKAAALGAITTGFATKYWVELVSLPPGNNNRLWLLVNNTWTHLANASELIQESVQNTFNAGSNLQTEVWYDATQTIVGLVVRSP